MLLGNLAVWVAGSGRGERVEWDATDLECTNLPGPDRSSGRPIAPAIRSTFNTGGQTFLSDQRGDGGCLLTDGQECLSS